MPGIGAKTARELLAHFLSIDEIVANREQIASLPIRGAVKIAAKIAENIGQLRLSRQLASIVEYANTVPDCNTIKWKGVHRDGFALFCEEMGFKDTFYQRSSQLKQRPLNALTQQTTG